MARKVFAVGGMSCASCVAHVQAAIAKIQGIAKVDVSLMEGRTVVEYDDTLVTIGDIKRVVESLGFRFEEEQPSVFDDERREYRELKTIGLRLLVALSMSILMMFVGMTSLVSSSIIVESIQAIAATVVYFFCAWGYHVRALNQLKSLTFSMDVLISMSISVAYFFSLYRLLWLGDLEVAAILRYSYFDVVGMIIAFVLLGKWLETLAKRRTIGSLRRLIALTPQTAMVEIAAGEYRETPIGQIMVGDRILIRMGDRVPVDGMLEGNSTFDESSLTGESLPIDRMSGDLVLSGVVCTGAPAVVVAHRVGAETTLSKIIETVRNAQASKVPIQRIADKISTVFVPIVLSLSLLALFLWGLSGVEYSWWCGLYFAISTLVIACPCALGLATPTAITVAMGRASECGVLVRDASALELLGKVTDVIFDKTGTLTYGRPSVLASLWVDESEQVKVLLASAETLSAHPIAEAITSHLERYKREVEIIDFVEKAGRGISFFFAGQEYSVGNKCQVLSTKYDSLETSSEVSEFEKKYSRATLVYYARGQKLLGILAIEDEVKADASAALYHLKHLGIRIHMLSGDRSERVAYLAHRLGVDEYKGGCLPSDKKDYIDSIKNKPQRVVAMVGDGINDSPALASADVSIAIATGADIAMDIAMVTTVGDSLMTIGRAVGLSRHTRKVIMQNFFWAFVYNLVALPIAAGVLYPKVFISPMWAAGAMAASSLCVVLNSLRLKNINV